MTVTVRRRRAPLLMGPDGKRWTALLSDRVSARTVLLCLVGLASLSSLIRIALVSRVQGPSVFMDELGYEKLAQSIGVDGRLALFDKGGLSYSPLYPAVLAPIYALGASAPAAYSLIKAVNAVLLALSVFPSYKIARFALPRRPALLVAALSAAAPLMSYSSFVMSESLAYPLCLVAVWAILGAVRAPSLWRDAFVLGAIALASAARLQLIVLVPVALTAILLAAVLDHEPAESPARSLLKALRRHWLLFGAVASVVLAAGVAALAGHGVSALGGRYAVVGRRGLPNLGHFLRVLVEHAAGIDFAVGVVPFVAALVAAYAFVRTGPRRPHAPFAAVAVSLTAWLLLETAWDAAKFDSPHGDLPRIHERFLIYVVPLFLVALVAAARLTERRASLRVYLGAVAAAALLPAAIRFDTVINNTAVVDTFGLQPFAHAAGGKLVAVPHAAIAAILAAALFGLLYVQVRRRLQSVVLLVLIAFVVVGGLLRIRIEAFSIVGASYWPPHADWVDRSKPAGDVALVAVDPTSALETAFANLTIDRVYTLCETTFGAEFGERHVTIDKAGRLRDGSEVVRASYVVVPWQVDVQGRVVVWSSLGGQVLVAPSGGRVTVPRWNRRVKCPPTAAS